MNVILNFEKFCFNKLFSPFDMNLSLCDFFLILLNRIKNERVFVSSLHTIRSKDHIKFTKE